jgi:hypothetical protein
MQTKLKNLMPKNLVQVLMGLAFVSLAPNAWAQDVPQESYGSCYSGCPAPNETPGPNDNYDHGYDHDHASTSGRGSRSESTSNANSESNANAYSGSDANANANVSVIINTDIQNKSEVGRFSGAEFSSDLSTSFKGYSNASQTPNPVEVMHGFNVMTAQEAMIATQSKHLISRKMSISAACIDDKGIPHPASQISPEPNISTNYTGELYRCIAGTYLQASLVSQAKDEPKSQVITCSKKDALWFEGASLSCRPQLAQRACHERSLLRRFGTGTKLVTINNEEVFVEQKKQKTQTNSVSSMVFNGGVGGFVQ